MSDPSGAMPSHTVPPEALERAAEALQATRPSGKAGITLDKLTDAERAAVEADTLGILTAALGATLVT